MREVHDGMREVHDGMREVHKAGKRMMDDEEVT